MLSKIELGGHVEFPAFLAERVYMREFKKKDGLPTDLKRWQPTVDQMLEGIDTDLPMYLMVDQAVVGDNQSHRRPGVHLDGYWDPSLSMHNGGGPTHGPRRHSSVPPGHTGRSPFHSSGSSRWEDATFDAPEYIILASDVPACRGYVGQFDGPIREGGDASEISLKNLEAIELEANRVYIGNVSFLHESLPIATSCERTLVRINAPH